MALTGWLGCCSDSPGVDCGKLGSGCTLRNAAEGAGVFAGTTSEGANWSTTEIGTLVQGHFSSVTTQNELKWGALSSSYGVYDFDQADETVEFAESAGMRVRGHALFWHRLNGPPAWLGDELSAAADPEARLRELMQEHTAAVMGRYAGRIHSWDVVNEPLSLFGSGLASDSIFFDTFADDEAFLDLAFELARVADPEAKLFLNEIFPSTDEAKFEGLLALVSGMIDRGVPIDGVGFQGHFVLDPPDREVIRQRLQAFADLGLEVEITELDISIRLVDDKDDIPAGQAELYNEVVAACLAVSACTGITAWNVHDGLTWLESDELLATVGPHEPTLFDAELQPKPAYYKVLDAFALAGTR